METKNSLPFEAIGKEWKTGSEDIGWDQMCFVRVLNQSDQLRVVDQEPDKHFYLPTTAEISGGEYPFVTSHWTINHKVSWNSWGDWLVPSAIVLAPARPLIELNDPPENLNAVDTFWAKGMSLPKEAVVVKLERVVDQDLIDEARRLKEDFKHNYSVELEDKYFETAERLNEVVMKEINKIIAQMGYTPLIEDNGNYVGEKNFDKAIAALGVREGIKSTFPHADTIWGEFERVRAITSFPDMVKNAGCVLDNFSVTTPAEKDLLLLFCAELYHQLKTDSTLLNLPENATALDELLNKHGDIETILQKWGLNLGKR